MRPQLSSFGLMQQWQRMLRLCIEGSSFRPNTIPRVLMELSQNEVAKALTWRFFRVNYKEFVRV
ncbi:hypothetical protein ANCDUO_02449 [Ancylostoma duodenale]|uniref:Uncharacterized protein n=1 Tax=Ancylostoma duodenale TaxID=51022 RepID=A0A0C2H6S4_9BILA|nr:hypothetical protein ANCDUO_02449 [Ancylostoma duodenale]